MTSSHDIALRRLGQDRTFVNVSAIGRPRKFTGALRPTVTAADQSFKSGRQLETGLRHWNSCG